MDAAGAFQACLGEMYRYRLAVVEQRARISSAIAVVRDERDDIETEEDQLMFAPNMPIAEFRDRIERLSRRDVPSIWRLKTEAEFQLDAIYGVLSMSRALRALADGEVEAAIQRAIARFERDAPDADLLRHLHVHLDEYIRGSSRDRHRLPTPDELGGVAMIDQRLVYFLGGKLFDLRQIADAAEGLAAAVAEATRDLP
jgi:hypothetical protein